MALLDESPSMFLGVKGDFEFAQYNVPVKMGFTSLGTGTGILQVRQSYEQIPTAQLNAGTLLTGQLDSNWVTAVNEFGQTPAEALGVTYGSSRRSLGRIATVHPTTGQASQFFSLWGYFQQGLSYANRSIFASTTGTAPGITSGQVKWNNDAGSPSVTSGQTTWTESNGSGELFYGCNFTQERGTICYYYARWSNKVSGVHPTSLPNPSERVPGRPHINSLTLNETNTSVTIGLGSDPTNDDASTQVYYRVQTSPIPPHQELLGASNEVKWRDDNIDRSNSSSASHNIVDNWSTSPVQSVTPNKVYYAYALGFTLNQPGLDGATITPGRKFITSSGIDYGLQVFSPQGQVVLDTRETRLGRLIKVLQDPSPATGQPIGTIRLFDSNSTSTSNSSNKTISVPGLPDGSNFSGDGVHFVTLQYVTQLPLGTNAYVNRNNNTNEVVLSYVRNPTTSYNPRHFANSYPTFIDVRVMVWKFPV